MTAAECWKWALGYEGLYEVSSWGRVCSFHSGRPRLLRPGAKKSGHLMVALCREGVRRSLDIHRLVLEAFVGPPLGGSEIRHRNGIPTDNRWPENIEYSTLSRNRQDRKWHRVRGDNSSKLGPSQVAAIRSRAPAETQEALACEFGVSQQHVSLILSGRIHRDVA